MHWYLFFILNKKENKSSISEEQDAELSIAMSDRSFMICH